MNVLTQRKSREFGHEGSRKYWQILVVCELRSTSGRTIVVGHTRDCGCLWTFEVRSSCQPPENAERPRTLNAYLAIAVVSMLRAQDLANSMSDVWVNTVQQLRNAAAACVCWKVSWAGKSWESIGRQRSALHLLLYVPLVIHFVGRQDINQNSHYLGDRLADL